MNENINPRLFGINHSNRDFTKQECWGKNQFNSSFPAALACYMSHRNLEPVYLTINNQLNVNHSKISVSSILGLDYTSGDLFFAFERDYIPYQDIVIGNLPRIDLVTIDKSKNNLCLSGIEIKLTALPDNTTCELSDDKYGCEIVVRPPTIVYLAVSIAKTYQHNQQILKDYLNPICNLVQDWTSPSCILSVMNELVEAVDLTIHSCINHQFPLIMQPIWKTEGKSAKLHEQCLDIFMWSNLAFTRLFIDSAKSELNSDKITRHKRCVVWLAKMLFDFANINKINHVETIDQISLNTKNDKAFALSGSRTHQYHTR
ncbi:HindVP family restriction endonuclease [Aphanothece sacrum]|uniref:Type II restriction enzyme HgiDI n=1 Tax=Aphanothece sacrum FPU1 TaxID=1920663 RepID=A0A401IBM8_APHSA|nr:HindVP family restriction endonuclease [Aphanothece sacrum]GBF78649.1 type II restriction enzyme HgiDI [Aphanothece sacrum FPU1]GBF84938.1 type II restriction enzyme HgiDI [Aphanothece sacrum FPU3]